MPGLMVCDSKEYANAHQRGSGGIRLREIRTVLQAVRTRDDPALVFVQGSVSFVFPPENGSSLDYGPLGESGLPNSLLLK